MQDEFDVERAKKVLLGKYKNRMHVNDFPELKRFSSELLNLDSILGGGIPIGRVIEIFGEESTGKTTLCTQIAKACMSQGKAVGFIDAERTTTGTRLKASGLDLSNDLFWLFEADDGDIALEAVEDFASQGFGLIIVDSVPFLKPAALKETDIEKVEISPTARLLNKMQPRIVAAAANNACTIIFINQAREKIGGYGPAGALTTMGGRALKHMCSIKLRLSVVFDEKLRKKDPAAIKTKITCIKNKTAPARQSCEIEIYPQIGCDPFMAAVEALSLPHVNLISNRGSFYYLRPDLIEGTGIEVPKLQGQEAVVAFFKSQPALFEEVYKRALKILVENPSEEAGSDLEEMD